MRVLVKICGVKTVSIARAVKECGADLLGFVFAASKRRVEPAQAQIIARDLKGVGKVGVFVNPARQEVLDIIRRCRLDFVQLHGNESEEFCQGLPVPVIKAFPATGGLGPCDIDKYKARWALLDTFLPGQHGGTGQVFDWPGMQPLCRDLKTPFLIAGGLTPANVAEAIRILRPHGVDVSGGVESDGRKDIEKIDRFIRAVRAVERGDLIAGKDLAGETGSRNRG